MHAENHSMLVILFAALNNPKMFIVVFLLISINALNSEGEIRKRDDYCDVTDSNHCKIVCCRQSKCLSDGSENVCCDDPYDPSSEPNCAMCPKCGILLFYFKFEVITRFTIIFMIHAFHKLFDSFYIQLIVNGIRGDRGVHAL